MHHTGEREDEEEGHAHKHMQFEEDVRIGNETGGFHTAEGNDVLRPLHEQGHFVAVHVACAHANGGEAEQEGHQNPHQQQLVAPGAVDVDAIDGEAAFDQNQQADQRHGAEDAAGGHGQELLGRMAHAQGMPYPQRGEQADEVAAEHGQYAHMKEDIAQAQLAVIQQLAGIALPSVLLAVEAHEAAEEENCQTNIGIDGKEEEVQVTHIKTPKQVCLLAFWIKLYGLDARLEQGLDTGYVGAEGFHGFVHIAHGRLS